MNINRPYTKLALLLGASINVIGVAAQAQNQDTPVQVREQVLESIVVTATRRSKSIQEVGLSMTAFSSEQLESKGVEVFFDFATAVPNLSFGVTGDGSMAARSIAIRGIQGGGTTGFYIDDTPVLETLDPRAFDIERIEVLRGPQGTLFGARSMGGTVRLITKQPDPSEISGNAHAGISFTNKGGANYIVDAGVNLPIVEEKLAVRVSGFYQYEEGVFDKGFGPRNATPTSIKENIDDVKAKGGQITFLWQATENLSITPRVMYQKIDQDGFRFGDLRPDNFLQRQVFDLPEGGTDEWTLYSLTANYYLADIGTFTSSTSYFDRDVFEEEDSSDALLVFVGLPSIVPAPITRERGLQRFVQETRFASDFGGDFQIVAGVFYSNSTVPRNYIWYGTGSGDIIGASSDLALVFTDKRKLKEFSVFGEASYQISPELKATVGMRYFENTSNFEQFTEGYFFGGASTINPPEGKETGINPKFLVEYKVTEDIMAYASVAEGYRIGGNNISIPDTCNGELASLGTSQEEISSYKSDGLWNYEIGLKTTLADQRVTLNASVYRADWSDIQTRVLLVCGFGYQGNAGKARSQGLEIELNALITSGLVVGVNVGYTDAKITEGAPGTGLKPGDRIYQVPEWTFSSNVEYSFPVSSNYEGFARSDYSYIGKSFSANNDPSNPRLRPAYTLLDMRFGLRNDDYEVVMYVKNLTNEHVNLSDNRSIGAEVSGLQRIVTNRPRTIGVEARAKF